MDKYYEQFKDATHQLGIEDIKLWDISNSSFVYLSWASWEGITLWRALQSVIWDVKIWCAHISNEWFYEFTWNNLHPIIKLEVMNNLKKKTLPH